MDLDQGLLEERRAQVRAELARFDVRGASGTEVWQSLAGRGWLDAGSLLDAAVVLEEVGRAAAPGPLLAQLEAGLVLAELGADARAGRRCSLALLEGAALDPGALRARASRRGKDWGVSGAKRFVPHAADAEAFLVVANRESSFLLSGAGLAWRRVK